MAKTRNSTVASRTRTVLRHVARGEEIDPARLAQFHADAREWMTGEDMAIFAPLAERIDTLTNTTALRQWIVDVNDLAAELIDIYEHDFGGDRSRLLDG